MNAFKIARLRLELAELETHFAPRDRVHVPEGCFENPDGWACTTRKVRAELAKAEIEE